MIPDMDDDKAEPYVTPDVYTEDYFLHCRHGSDEFTESGGREISPIHLKILDLAEAGEGRRVLDVGCGCGELVIHSALRGAEAVGVDYSSAANALAVKAAKEIGVDVEFFCCDVSELPEGKFDSVILADVVEHLYQYQLDQLYKDLFDRLNPDGILVIHTWPNRWHTTYSYPVARNILNLFGRNMPKSPRKPHDEIMHVNEQSVLSLQRDLRKAGFRSKVWLEHPIPEDRGMLYRFCHEAPFVKLFFADHLFAIARK